jgi:hypothetical protein
MAVPSVTIAQTFEVFEGGYCYWTNFLNVFSEKYGLILLMSLNMSSIQIFPELSRIYLDKISEIRSHVILRSVYHGACFRTLWFKWNCWFYSFYSHDNHPKLQILWSYFRSDTLR